MLEQMGVSNALEVVEQQLAINTANLADAQENLNELKEEGVDSSIDLADATATELVELIHNAEQLGYNVDALKLYLQQKIQTNQITLSTSGDIENLANLCSRLGIAGTALEKFAKLKNATLGAPYKDGQSSSKVPTLGVSLNAMNNPNAFINEVNNSYENSVQGIMDELNDALLDFVSADVKNIGVDFVDKSNNTSSKNSNSIFDHIKTKISRIQREITNLGKKVSATYLTWTTRNDALLSELAKVNEEILTQKQAYEKYLALANSVGLSEPYKSLVQSGGLRIDTITDENLKEKIEKYQEYYDKYLQAYDAYLDGTATLAEKAREQFDLAASEYDSYIETVTSKVDMLNAYIDQVEARGHLVSASYYEQLKRVEEDNISNLEAKYNKLSALLKNAVDTGTIQKGSEEYNNMKAEIDDVQQALIEANTALIEYDNSIRDLNWEVFDKIQDKISQITEETDFLLELISDEKMFDGGEITEFGQATMGLHAVNYETYMKQSKEYGAELLEINKQLAEDSNNWELIERKQELIQLQRESILASRDELQSILDLKQEGFDELLDSLDEAIKKYNELQNSQKDLYDFEKSVNQQVKEISSLEKQLMAYQNDDSESAKSKVQQIMVDLETARESLEETEMDRNIQEREQLLQNLSDSAHQFVSEKMDNQDQILREVMEETNINIDSIRDTLEKEAGEVGITLSDEMNKIFGEGSSFVSIESTISTTLIDIKGIIQSMATNSNKVADSNIGNVNNPSVPSSPAPNTPSQPTKTPSTTNDSDSSSGSGKWGSWFIPKKDSYDKSKLKPEVSIIDRLKKWNFDSSMSARASYYQAMGLGSASSYKGSSKQNTAMIAEMRKHGYKKGTSGILEDELNWIHPNEVLYRASDGGMLHTFGKGDKVFTEEMANNLWNMSKVNLIPSMPKYDFMASNFDYFVAQAKKGNEANVEINRWLEDGLESGLVNIKNNNNEDPVMDKHGFWGRAYDSETGNILPEQFRATHNILGFTDNNWLSTTCALGKHNYYKFDAQGNLVQDTAYGLTSQFVTAGYIYGSQIISGDIYSENYKLDSEGSVIQGSHLSLKDGSFSFGGSSLRYDPINGLFVNGNITSGSTITGSKIIGGSIEIGKNFTVDEEGNVVGVNSHFTNGTFTGTITTDNLTATGGIIGGWYIIDGVLYDYDGTINTMGAGMQSGQYDYSSEIQNADISFWAGAPFKNRYLAPFLVKVDGSVTANSLTTNNITATGGVIGGCTIKDGVLQIGNVNIREKLTADSIDATNLKVTAANVTGTLTASQIDATDLKVSAANVTGQLTASQINTTGLIAENISGTTITGKTISGGQINIGNGVFTVSTTGAMKCTSATITGVLTASSGSSLGGFKTDSNSIYYGSWGSAPPSVFMCTGSSTKYSLGGSPSTNGWCFGAGSNFGVTNTGAMYARSGKIGDWYLGYKSVTVDGVTKSGYALYSGTTNNVFLFPDGVAYYDGSVEYYASWARILAKAQ